MRLFLTIMAMFVCGYSDLASAQQLPECQDGKAVSFKGTIQSVSPLSGIPPLPTMWTIVIAQTGGDCAVSEIVLEVQPNAECVVGATIEGKGDTGEDVVAASNKDVSCK